jgi:hypothetical protein
MIEKYSLCLNELLRASCPPPFGPAELFKFAPGELVRKNLAANLDRSPLIHSYCYESVGDHSTFAYRDVGGRATQGAVAEKARFPLILSTWRWSMQVMQEHLLARPFMQYTG